MTNISFHINHSYNRLAKRKMYSVYVLEEENPLANDSDKLVYSIRKKINIKINIRYKKEAEEIVKNYTENIKNLILKLRDK